MLVGDRSIDVNCDGDDDDVVVFTANGVAEVADGCVAAVCGCCGFDKAKMCIGERLDEFCVSSEDACVLTTATDVLVERGLTAGPLKHNHSLS